MLESIRLINMTWLVSIMANSDEYIEYVMLKLEPMGLVQYKKMFGERMIYIDGKPILLVCGNSCYLKKWPELV